MLFSSEPMPALDRREGLIQYLSEQPEPLHMPSLAEYLSFSDAERKALDAARLTFMSTALTVGTPQIHKLIYQVRLAIVNNRGKATGRGGVIVSGESTVGKTTACVSMMRSFYFLYGRQYVGFLQRNEVPVAYVEVPAGSSAKAMVRRFAEFYGLEFTTRATLETMLNAVVTVMRSCRTQLVVVDELQNLSRISPGNGESVDVLKSLSNQVPATFVYSGINIHQGGLLVGDRGSQIGRRFTLLRMSRYGIATSEDRKVWNGLVMAFSNELPLLAHSKEGLIKDSMWLHQRSGGNLGTLQRLIVGAAQLLVLEGDPEHEALTRECMKNIPLDMTAEAASNRLVFPAPSQKKQPES